MDRSIIFYRDVFGANILVKGRKLAYFDLDGLWVALNQVDDGQVNERVYPSSNTHIAFTVATEEFGEKVNRLLGVRVLPGRERDERDKLSVYFLDPDGHQFEFHTGSLQDRLDYYRSAKEHMHFFETPEC
ncbi:fosfomycin resistance protein FosB [Paenibacillus pini JCM 16418]|uniref:Fosfomycin resistance protein FosB n=2 Tax=Paenibacillus TaxID=44249 RepID=W7YTA7_9BACL|nr:fosfomycin resistance protein FosB [Paenibacillus pini JCM 16418]